jgi:acyl carrier protein
MTTPSDDPATGGIDRLIADAICRVLHDTGREPVRVDRGMLLGKDLGLDSLDIAQTIVLLERELGVDPFRHPPAGVDRPAVRTVGDLIAVYSLALPR